MPKKAKNSSTRRDLVSDQIRDKAATLFANRGVSGTSLKDVADSLGISRTALYHYIGSKDELLEDLVAGITKETANELEALVADKSLGPVEKLERAVRQMVLRIASNPSRFRLLLVTEGEFAGALRREHRSAQKRTLVALSAIIEAGIQTDEFRQVNGYTGSFAVLGMCNWVALWYQPDRDPAQTPEAIADEIADLALHTLRSAEGRGIGEGVSVAYALRVLREDLTQLERAVEDRNGVGPG